MSHAFCGIAAALIKGNLLVGSALVAATTALIGMASRA